MTRKSRIQQMFDTHARHTTNRSPSAERRERRADRQTSDNGHASLAQERQNALHLRLDSLVSPLSHRRAPPARTRRSPDCSVLSTHASSLASHTYGAQHALAAGSLLVCGLCAHLSRTTHMPRTHTSLSAPVARGHTPSPISVHLMRPLRPLAAAHHKHTHIWHVPVHLRSL